MTPARFPHSDTPGSTLGCQLPRAYRRLLRPSSALDAKASTMCPSQLVTHTTNPTPPRKLTNNGVVSGRRCTQHATKEPTHTNTIRSACVSYKTNNSSHPGLIQGTQELSDARVHYPDLKQQPHTPPAGTHGADSGAGWYRSPRTRPPPTRRSTRVRGAAA